MSSISKVKKAGSGKKTKNKNNSVSLASGDMYSHPKSGSAIGASAANKKTFSLGPAVQTKVTVGQAGDRYEREADSVADKVTSGRQAGAISRIPSGGLKAQPQLVQREAEDGEESAQMESDDVQEKCASCDSEDNTQKKSDEEVEPAQAKPSEPEGEVQEKCATCEKEDSVQKTESESGDEAQTVQRKEEPESVTPEDAQTQLVQREPEDGEESDDEEGADAGPIGGEDDPDAPDCGAGGEASEIEDSGGETAEGEEATEGEEESEPAEAGGESETGESAGGEEVGCGEEGGEEEAEPEGGPTTDAHAEQTCGGGAGEASAEESESEGVAGEEAGEEGAGSEPPIRPEAAPSCADEVAEHEDTAAETAPEGEAAASEVPAAAGAGGECAQTKSEDDSTQPESEDANAQEMVAQKEDEESAQESADEEAQMDGESGASDCSPAEAEAEAQMKTETAPAAKMDKSDIAARAIKNRDSGEPLTPAVREKLEQSLRMDLSSVRVHTGTKAQQANKGLRAKAFTHKNHIWLGTGYSQSDIKLMAHEVTHTVQQGAVTKAKGGRNQNTDDEETTEGNANASAMMQMEADLPGDSVQTSPKPTQRAQAYQWDPRHYQRAMEIKLLIDQVFEEEYQNDNAKKKEIIRQIEAQVESMWRDFKSYVDSQGGFAGLSGEEKTYLEEEEKNIKESEKSLTPLDKVAEKDKEQNALRRKALSAMGNMVNDVYAAYWLLVSETIFLWQDVKNETIPVNVEKFSASIKELESGKTFVKSDFRRLIYGAIAEKYNIDIEDVWALIEPQEEDKSKDDTAGGNGGDGEGEGDKPKNLEGASTANRKRKLTKEQEKLLKRLPKSIQKSEDQDALINLLDHLLTLEKDQQDALIKQMHEKEKQRAESDKQTSKKDMDKKPSDPKIDVDELKTEQKTKDLGEEIFKDKIKDETNRENEKNELAELLKSLPEDERRAFLEFLESVQSDAQHADKKSAKEIHDAYKQLSETDKEALKVRKLLNDQKVDESQKLTDADQKAVRAMVKQQQTEAGEAQATVSSMNEDIAFIADMVSDPDAKKAMVPFDPDDFRIMPEMMMLYGIMDGAGRMSPELKEAADGLKSQIGQIRGKIISEIKWIAAELALHAGLGAIPVVGWLKTAASAVRLINLGRRLNKLRKTLTALKKGYDTFNRVRHAIEQARGIVNSAPGFVKKFEQARKNWESLQAQLENMESSEDIEERLELAFEQLMEQMEARLEALEPFLEKLYLPENVQEDPEALVRILFNMPKGIDSFGDMLRSYEKLGNTSEPRELELLYYKGAQTGALLYPLVGFIIGEMSEALGDWLGRQRGLDSFLEKRKKWRARGKDKGKSATGSKFGSLWSRKLEYKDHSKGHTPQFTDPMKKGAEYLDKQIPKTNIPWQYRIKVFLRFKLRQIVKHLNKLNLKVWGRRKPKRGQTPEDWHLVPLPPFKYKLSRSGKYHNITLKINPEHERKVEMLDYSTFKDKGIPLPDFKTDEGKALKKWLGDNGYELNDIKKIGWHIRRSGRNAVTKEPLRIKNGHIIQGLESTDSAALDNFIGAKNVIGDNIQLPDGFHLQALTLSGVRDDSERYTVKKHPYTTPAYQLHLDEDAKLAKGPASGKQMVVLESHQPADPAADSLGRPHKVSNQQVGYTVNKPRGPLPNVPDKLTRDDKGHMIAHRFNGSDRLANLVAMNSKLNQKGAWYKQEAAFANAFKRAWQLAAVAGQKVAGFLTVTANYLSTNKTRRPNSFDMSWEVKKEGKNYANGSISNEKNK